ncbi:MAG: ABC transporter permease [Clostridia bacterium]|nr:ABC transporter permease [Clostridia bacterium]
MLFHIALKDLKVVFRDKKAMAIMLVMPILIVLILGFGLGWAFNSELAIQKFTLGVVNHDDGLMSQVFINQVLRENMSKMFTTFVVDETEAEEILKDKVVPCVIVIPQDFSKSIEENKPVQINIQSNDDGQIKSAVVRSVTEGFAQNLSLGYAGAFAASDVFAKYKIPFKVPIEGISQSTAIMSEIQKKLGGEMIKFEQKEQQKEKNLSAMEYYSAAMLVMFLLFGASMGTKLIVEERENSTLGRVMSARPGKFTLITGKFLGLMFICLTQAGILILFTRIFYGVGWGASLAGIFLITLSSVFAAAAFGMFIAAIAKTPKAADALSQLFIQTFTVLGGGMWPIYLMPDTMKTIARFTLNWWAFKGYHELMLGMNLSTVLPYCGILIFMGLIYLGAGVLRFRV